LNAKRVEGTGSLKETIFNDLLPLVSKPGRYIGNEVNIVRKDLNDVDVRFALVFPDVYEVGMSYLGFPILYHLLNRMPGVYAERAFAPWTDLEERMRQQNVPLFSLETFSSLADFDVVGFTVQYELHGTTIINLIDLIGLPVWARERTTGPLIIAGGPSVFNPEPMAEFFDAIVIGDGEDAVREIAELVRTGKQQGWDRRRYWRELAAIPGIYVPALYEAEYDDRHRFKGLQAAPGAPARIRARIVESLSADSYPAKPLVPVIPTTHDRVSLEIARGCSRGCRFCNAGMIYRPVRQRTVSELVAQAVQNIESTGYDEVSLVSLSTSDYEELEALMAGLRTALAKDMVNLSFPSLRPEKFTPQVAYYAKDVRKSGLTLAPEAGCQRLRDLINKTTTEDDLIAAVQLAFREGWKLIKLYFMIGHPTETESDLNEMINLIHKVAAIARIHKGAGLHVSISPFVPKAVTPFQWCRQDRSEEIRHKIGYIKERVRDKRIKLSWREADLAQVEGVLARGDRRMSRVIWRVWQAGARLEGWSEHFSSARWRQAMAEEGLSYEWFTDAPALDAPLPWDHIDKGVTKKFLRDEYERALDFSVTPDCRDGDCQKCGLMGKQVCQAIVHPLKEKQNVLRPGAVDNASSSPSLPDESKIRMARLKYRRDDAIRFLSHLDVIHLFERTLRRARVAMVYSSGFNPHPRMAFGPPLTTGYRSEAEYLDLHYYAGDDETMTERLAAALPDGLTLLEIKPLFNKHRNLTDVINRADYFVDMPTRVELEKLAALMQQAEIPVLRSKEGEPGKTVDIRPYIAEAEVKGQTLRLVTRIEQGKTVRVNEILTLLLDGQNDLVKRCLVTRTGLYIQFGDLIVTPMDV
jgi:radical SAM family uncharacterized protein/radical SAM-linked protein